MSPASGVSGAVTGYPIGRGNGVNSVFTVPSEITAVSTLYRRDWQGNVALGSSPRTNGITCSSDFGNWAQANGSLVTSDVVSPLAPNGTATMDLLTAGAVSASSRNSNPVVVSAGSDVYASIYISKGTGTLPTISIYNAEITTRLSRIEISWSGITPVLGGIIGMVGTPTVEPTQITGVYRICFRFNTGIYTSVKMLVYPNQGGSGTGTTYFWGAMVSAEGGAYIPTTTAPVTITDYTASGTTLTLSEAPALAAELTVDGTGVDLPLLQIGG